MVSIGESKLVHDLPSDQLKCLLWLVSILVCNCCCRAQNLYPVTVDDYELVEVVGKGASATVSVYVMTAAVLLTQPVPVTPHSLCAFQ